MRKIFFTIFTSLSLFWLWAMKISAQTDNWGINDFASGGVYLGTRPLRETIAGVVNIALGFLGILAVLLILYGGYLWMTSQGNSDKVQRAKLLIISAVIGLVIILSAYAISRFILSSLYDSAGPGSGTSTSTIPGGSIPGCDEPGDNYDPRICSLSPTSGSAGTYITIRGWHFETDNDPSTLGEVRIGGEIAEIVTCGGNPIWRSTRVRVKVPDLAPGIYNVILTNDQGRSGVEPVAFTFNVIPGTAGPNIACLIPEIEDADDLPALVVIEGVGFSAAGNLSMTGWDIVNGQEITLGNADLGPSWGDTRIEFSVPDNALTSQVIVEVAGQSDQDLFTVRCGDDSQCASGCCYPNSCRIDSVCSGTGTPGGPYIDYISPDNGTEDNLITIYGSGFGNLEGTVTFDSAAGTISGVDPSSLNAACADTWTDNYIVIAVPADAISGDLSITQNIAEGGETSNFVTFTRNNIVRPGICGLSAASGQFEQDIDIYGLNFTFPAPPDDRVFFGNYESQDVNINSNILARVEIPNVEGNAAVVLESGASSQPSNPFPFTALPTIEGLPIIMEISPATGPAGQYITIMGANFGNSQGQVLFDADGANVNGDFSFPEICMDNYWRNNQIIVKVPDNVAIPPVNTYPIRVIRSGDGARSEPYNFEINNNPLGPQVCLMTPDNGLAGELISFYGENFSSTVGNVVFYNGAFAAPVPAANWHDNAITGVAVPTSAVTGPVYVSTGIPSNALNFTVDSCLSDADCGEYGPGYICCPGSAGNSCVNNFSCEVANYCEYDWTVTAMPAGLTVIDHAPDCNGACANSWAYARFNFPINEATFGEGDFHVYDESDNDIANNHWFAGGTDLYMDYDVPLANNATYRIVLETSFQDVFGDSLDESYTWSFTTGEEDCVIQDARISPRRYISYLSGELVEDVFGIVGINNNVNCGPTPIYCDPGMCSYGWTSGNPLAPIVGPSTDQTIDIRNDLLSGSDYSDILGTIIDNSTGIPQSFSDDARFYMDIQGIATPPFRILQRWPDCNGACSDPVVRVRVNSDITLQPIDSSLVHIYDEDGNDISTAATGNGELVDILYNGPLSFDHAYRVVLERGFVYDANGNTLNRDYTWTFTTGDRRCVISNVDVSPASRTSNTPLEVLNFQADASDNSINCGEIPVYCSPGMCTYDWTLSDMSVATIVSANNLQSVDVRNDLLSGSGQTRAQVELTDSSTGSPQVFSDSGVLNIDIDTPVVYNAPTIIDYQPTGTELCTNIAPYIDFSESMNGASISDHIKLYQDTPTGWQAVSGNFRFSNSNLDADPERETRAVFQASSLLATSTVFWMAIDDASAVLSTYGLSLDPAPLGAAPMGGVGWSFETGDHICQIYNAIIDPDPDWFTCTGRNNCDGDDNLGVPGNQHRYTAYVQDIAGYLLNGVFLDFDWSLSNSLVTQSGPFSGLGLSEVYGTVGPENGNLTLSMSVESTQDPSRASDSSLINIFLCENPWPSVLGFPWNETSYNFSTYYCYDSGLPGGTVLPYLNYPPNPSPSHAGVLREYIFPIFNTLSETENKSFSGRLGSLRYSQGQKDGDKLVGENLNWLDKIARLIGVGKVAGQEGSIEIGPCTPANPSGLAVVDVDDSHVSLQWEQARFGPLGGVATNSRIERRQIGVGASFSQIGYVPVVMPNPQTYTDNTVVAGASYEYRVWSYNSSAGCSETSLGASNVVSITASDNQPSIDIIGIRIMPNTEHLSVSDWFRKYAPNPNAVGELTEVDGYEALRVGNTIYIAATNIVSPPASLYTNIYILAYNIGAKANTVEIFNQLLANFKLNTNLNQYINNTCRANPATSCSSDFDCPVGDWCDSQKLKLRRDTKRLGDLVGTSLRLTEYGNNHKACSNNSLISCSVNNDCPGAGTCVPYYPLINAGSYIQGMTTSKWPSWAGTFGPSLNASLSLDPINLFNGCDPDADPNTCWNESSDPNEFICPLNSLIYFYNVTNFGRDYLLAANFEYDMHDPQFNVRFSTNLYPQGSVAAIEDANLQRHLLSNISFCNGTNVSAPGAAGSEYCGNGIIDNGYCTDPSYDTQFNCLSNGGIWITSEECDGGFYYDICNDLNGNHNWWNPRIIGCNPPGTIDPTSGSLIECTWYEPVPPFTPAQCGGYCGDGTIQPYYEGCEGANYNGVFTCGDPADSLYCGSGCNPMCNNADGPNYPAARCGDGIWNPDVEQCDPSANPNGLANWACTAGGFASCTSSCQVACSVGTPYLGACGDGNLDVPQEVCDPLGYVAPLPPDSSASNAYSCNAFCQFNNQYCGNGIVEYAYQEICDYAANYSTPSPGDSGRFNQYECRSGGWFNYDGIAYGACSATAGGWCGDGNIQGARGEDCDPGDPWASVPIPQSPLPPTPGASNADNQYSCQSDCTGRTGGYCGDGVAQQQYGELCDGLDYPDRPLPPQSNVNNTYVCANNCIEDDPNGGWCGDGVVQSLFGEGCDSWGASDWPWPRGNNLVNFSSPINQYECNSCINEGGYCGDGIVQIYEQCDSGFDPAYEIEKDIDIVYVFDMSGSMATDAWALCTALQEVVFDLDNNHPEIDYRVTIYPLGDSDGAVNGPPAVSLTSTVEDDIITIFNDSGWGWLDDAQQVFYNLVSNCPLYTNAANYPNVRYLSFYDNNTNQINNGVNINGDDYYGAWCTDSYDYAGRLENWGYAVKRIAEDYNWRPDYQRVIIPVSDEAAYCGGNVTIYENEDYDDVLPDVLTDAVNIATNSSIPIRISPVLRRWNPLFSIGQRLADDTGGIFTSNITGWAAQTINIINASFCDGDGDNFMDCTLP